MNTVYSSIDSFRQTILPTFKILVAKALEEDDEILYLMDLMRQTYFQSMG